MSQTKAQLIDNLVQPITGALGSASAPTFSFTADPNTGMYSPGADQLALSTGGTGRLFIDGSGQVGIATTSPQSRLHVEGVTGTDAVRLVGASSQSSALAFYNNAQTTGRFVIGQGYSTGSDNNGFVVNGANSNLIFGTNDTERMRLTSTGALGLGTSSPSNILEVSSNGTSYIRSTSTTNSISGVIGAATSSFDVGTTSSHAMNFYTAGVNRATLDTSGRLGIGTTSPTYVLQVAGGSSGSQFAIGDGSPRLVLDYRTPTTSTAAPTITSDGVGLYYFGRNGFAGEHVFYTGTSNTERMRLDSSGRLGLGTSSPGYLFTAAGAGGSAVLNLLETGVRSWGIRAGGALTNTFDISDFTAGQTRLTIDSSGRVGIGTASPAQKLEVSLGTIRAGDSQATNGSLILEGNYSGSDVLNTFGSQFSSASTVIGYAVRPRAGAAGYTSSAGNAGFYKAALEVGADGPLKLLYSATATTPIGNVVSMTEALRVDTVGRLLIGTSIAPAGGNAALTKLHVGGNTSGNIGVASIGSTLATASINNGLSLGILTFSDASSGEYGFIACQADGTVGTNDYPGRFIFATTADGASSPTERMRIAQNGVITAQGVYDFTTANAANVAVLSAGQIYRSTSSSKYKTDIETLENAYSEALLECRPVWYRSTCESDNPSHSWWGFIAEEVAAIDPRLVHWKTVQVNYDEKGSAVETPCDPEPEGVAYDRFVPHLLNLVKRQKEQIEAMEARLSALEAS
jgi:hypothetical protein